ncbi:putative reverse transcriptase domain-containing protein [Tanacetum coccineum]
MQLPSRWQCAPRCNKCKKFGHLARNCRGVAANANTQRVVTCFECGVQWHYKKDFPKLKNKNQGNKVGNGNAQARAYAVGTARTNLNSNVVMDHGYDVELADGKIIGVNNIIRGCTLNFLNHPFNIDLMLVELGIFDVIIGMDWKTKYHAVIVCDEKIICIPFGNKILIVHGNGSNNGHESRLNIISCTKTQKYLLKGCHVFLAHITAKEAEDKSEEKRLEDVPIIDLIPGAAPVAQAPYRLALLEMKELSDQLFKNLPERTIKRQNGDTMGIYHHFKLITEYLVNISKRRAFWSLNEDILKITILKTNMSYPSRKIRRIRACTHQRPQRKQAQYAVSREDQYAALKI